MKFPLRDLSSRVIEAVCRATPTMPHVVVTGYPNDEGNAVEVVRALIESYPGKIYWLVDQAGAWELAAPVPGLKMLAKSSISGIYAYATAEAVFYTHGIYGDCRASPQQTVVNLWHGDGFKLMPDTRHRRRSTHPADFVVGATRVLTERKACDFRMPMQSAIVVGNPRVDQFDQPVSPELLRSIAGDPPQPFVVWLPTFRTSTGSGRTQAWSDVSEDADSRINEGMQRIVGALGESGVRVVIKPHPMDKDMRQVTDAVVVDDAELRRHGASLYSLMGAAAGIITDYSSVWTDFLVLDRPIGFYVPDLDDYRATRGIYPADGFDWLPGPVLESRETIAAFANELVGGGATTQPLRTRSATRFGLAKVHGSVSHRLLRELDRVGAFSKAGGLRKEGARTAPMTIIRRKDASND